MTPPHARLDRFTALLDGLDREQRNIAAHALIGCLSSLVDDETWDKALAYVEGREVPA